MGEDVTLTQDQMIQDLLMILKKNQMTEKANDVFELVTYVDSLEQKLDQVIGELMEVKNQLTKMKEETFSKAIRDKISNIADKLEDRCAEMKVQLTEVKVFMTTKAKEIVDTVKRNGKSALNMVSEFVGLKGKLASIREHVEKTMVETSRGIAKIDEFGKGMREAGELVVNSFRTVRNKDVADASTKEKTFSKTEMFKKPFQLKLSLLESMKLRLDAAIDKVENLSRDVELSNVGLDQIDNESQQTLKELRTESVAEDGKYAYGCDAFDAFKKNNIGNVVEEGLLNKVSDAISNQRGGVYEKR